MLQQAPTQTTNPSQTVDTAQALAQLRSQLERTQAAYVSTIMEKNFLKRAMRSQLSSQRPRWNCFHRRAKSRCVRQPVLLNDDADQRSG